MTFEVDPDTGDMVLRGGTLPKIYGTDEVAQDIRSCLLTILGEWFLDTTIGLDWENTFTKNPSIGAITAQVRGQIESRNGVDRVDTISLVLNNVTRGATIQARVLLDSGEILNISESV